MLINPDAIINIMSLNTLVYFQINTPKLESNQMVLKIFNESGEMDLSLITLTFEAYSWAFEAMFHNMDSGTSFNALLGRP